MIRAYNENYLNNAEKTMGILFHEALEIMDADTFTTQFLRSRAASAWEDGNPAYLAGKSGDELFLEITGRKNPDSEREIVPQAEYWCGMVYCHAQWHFGCSFSALFTSIPLGELIAFFNPLHEADISKTIGIFHERLFPTPALKAWREKRQLSQSQLARISGVNLRSIKAYEQGDLDIARAQYDTLAYLAGALSCEVRDLIS